MENHIPTLIENIDSTKESDELIINIYEDIKQKLHEPDATLEICDELYESYCDLCSLESKNASVDEWWDLYFDFKCLRYFIESGNIEHNLEPRRRIANINLIDGILFYMKLTMVRPRKRGPFLQPFKEAIEDEDYSS